MVVLVYLASHSILRESGLVAVTVFGIALANQKAVQVKHVIEFKENLRVLLISCLFIVLAARLELGDLRQLGMRGGLFLATLLLIVRPAAVYGPRDRGLLDVFQAAHRGIRLGIWRRPKIINMGYVRDITSGIILAGEKDCPSGEAFLLGERHNHD